MGVRTVRRPALEVNEKSLCNFGMDHVCNMTMKSRRSLSHVRTHDQKLGRNVDVRSLSMDGAYDAHSGTTVDVYTFEVQPSLRTHVLENVRNICKNGAEWWHSDNPLRRHDWRQLGRRVKARTQTVA